MNKEKLKTIMSDNMAVFIQLFIQIALFCLVASSILWDKEASFMDALSFISIFFIAQVMTFNNMTGYGSKLQQKTPLYTEAYTSFTGLVKFILKCNIASTHLQEFIELHDKQKFEDDIKVALLPTFMSIDKWKESEYSKMTDKQLMELSNKDGTEKPLFSPKQVEALVEANNIKIEPTDIDRLMSGMQKTAPKSSKWLTKRQKIAIKNCIRFAKYIITSVLYTYIMFGFDEVNGSTVSNYFIKSMPLIWTMMTAINFGKSLEMDNIAEFNDNKLLLKQFIEWLQNVKKIKLTYTETPKQTAESQN